MRPAIAWSAAHPRLRVVAASAGAPDGLTASRLAEAKPEIVLAAFGAGRQEHFLEAHLGAIGAATGIGVGGSLDYLAGRVRRAPAMMRRLGLEWAWRLAIQPWRVRRQAVLPVYWWLERREARRAMPPHSDDLPVLSVIVPAYNEEQRLPATLNRMREYLDGRDEPYEVLVVDDGSTDDTLAMARTIAEGWPQLQVLALAENTGKGAAVRLGHAHRQRRASRLQRRRPQHADRGGGDGCAPSCMGTARSPSRRVRSRGPRSTSTSPADAR